MVPMNLFLGQQWRRRHRKQTNSHSKGMGKVGMNGESSMETHTLPYVKQTASGNLLDDSGSSNRVLCDNREGWDGTGGRREVQEGGDTCG